MKTGNNRQAGITAAVLRELSNRPGEIVYLKDLVDSLKLDAKQIQAPLVPGRLANYPIRIEVVVPAQAWRYMGDKLTEPQKVERPEKRIFQEIGPVRDGSLVLQDTDGNLWRATEL